MVRQCCVKIIRGGQQQQRMTLHTCRHANGRQSFKSCKKRTIICANCTSLTCFTGNGFSQWVKNNTIIYPEHHKEQVSLISLQWCWSFFFYWLTKYRCKLWLRPENMGFNYALPALRYLVLVVSPTFCGCAAPIYDKTPTAMCKPQQRASWRGAKLSYVALQFTLMKWPQQKADLSSPFFSLLFWDEARTVGTDIYLLLYLQHVNQRHLISEKAYNYTLGPAVMFS